MAIPHLHIENYSRKQGHNACRKAAYNSAQSLVLEGTEEVADFRRHKRCVVESYLLMKDGQRHNDTQTRQNFWGAVETSEKRKDACTCKGIDCALPIELSIEQNKALALEFSKTLITRYGYAGIDIAYHAPTPYAPRKQKSQRAKNPHLHILVPDRDADGNKIRVFYRNPPEIRALRQLWQDHVNQALANAGLTIRIDMRSYKAQAESHRQEAEKIQTEIDQLQAELREAKSNERQRSRQPIADHRAGKTARSHTSRTGRTETDGIKGFKPDHGSARQAGRPAEHRRSASYDQTGETSQKTRGIRQPTLGKSISQIRAIARTISDRLDAIRYQRSAIFNRPGTRIANRLDALRYQRSQRFRENLCQDAEQRKKYRHRLIN